MSKEMVEVAKKERQRLIDELHSTPTWKRLAKVEELLKEYGGLVERAVLSAATKAQPPVAKGPQVVRTLQKGETKQDKIDRLAMEYVKSHGPNVSGRKIHEYVQSHGIEVSQPSFSAYMSKNKALVFDVREKGWNLRDEQNPDQAGSASPEKDTAPVEAGAVNGGALHHRPHQPH